MAEREQATRLADVTVRGDLPGDLDDSRICYWKGPDEWWIYLPRAGIGRLTAHKVVENPDRTITVSPSIGLRTSNGAFERHGFLEDGKWREV